MLARDRDVLAIEPHAFTDAIWAGRHLAAGTASLSGTTLTAATSTVDFIEAQASAGQVVVFNGVPLEVLSRTSGAVLEVSRLRASAEDPALTPAPASAVSFTLASFAPHLAIVHRQLMGMLGLDRPEGPGVEAIVDPAPVAHAEALGALHLIYAAASALSGPSSALGARAAMYADMFSRARQRLAVGLDLDGDGGIDATRRPALTHLIRG